MAKYSCKVYWEMSGEITVEAATPEEAAQKAIDAPALSSYQSRRYVDDSCNCDPETDVQKIKK
jgi:hypothetical protein